MKLARADVRRDQDPHGSISTTRGGYEDVDGPRSHGRRYRARDLAQEPLAAETTTLDEFRSRWRLVTDVDGTRWVPR